MEEMDTPGFITTSVGESSDLREVFLPERFVIELDNQLEQSEADEKEVLYRIGKRFGMRYAVASSFPTIGEESEKNFNRFFDFFVKYVESIYAREISHELDTENRELEMEMDSYMACSKDGVGQMLGAGAVAGVMGYMYGDMSLEGVEPCCQGRGDEKCVIEVADVEKLSENPPCTFEPDEGSPDKIYWQVNKSKPPEKNSTSMENLLDKGQFNFEKGLLRHNESRYLLAMATLPYIIEQEVESVGLDSDVLFEAGLATGQAIGSEKGEQFAQDFLTALGWGEIRVISNGEKVYCRSFPWSDYETGYKHQIFCGLLSGLLWSENRKRYGVKSTSKSSKGYDIKLG